jgi:hypothetical protein
MRNTIVLTAVIALIGGSPEVSAQNLVPNGGFELFTSNCQFGLGYHHLEDWTEVECALPPGLAHTCNSDLGNGGGVPYGSLGYNPAHGGDAFICIWTLRMESQGGFPDGNPQKYATVELTQPLEADQHYCIRLWMNMSDSSCYRTGALHAYLGYGMASVCNYQDQMWDTYAAATWDISAVDTAEWTLLEAGFDASGGETSLTIGAFQFGEEIDSVFIADHSLLLGGLLALYFIDDVELWACQVGVDEVHGSTELSVYPNPAVDVVNVELPRTGGTLELLTTDGRSLRTLSMNTERATIDVQDLPGGEYVLRIRQEAGVWMERFAVVK